MSAHSPPPLFLLCPPSPQCSFPLVLSRLPTLKANLEVVLNNEGQRFDMDPNGCAQIYAGG